MKMDYQLSINQKKWSKNIVKVHIKRIHSYKNTQNNSQKGLKKYKKVQNI